MSRSGHDRGQSIQIGAVLLFGALVVSLSIYQAFVVPEQNKKVEFNHNQDVQNQMADLRNAIVSMPGRGTTKSVSIRLGTQYPSRIVAINPGPPVGQLYTTGTDDSTVAVTVDNAQSTDGETDDYWDGTSKTFATGVIEYQPNYNHYQNPPTTVYANSILHNEFDTGSVSLSEQTVVDDETISLVMLNGSLTTSSIRSESVDVQPVSVSTTTVPIESSGSPITLTFPTHLSQSRWDEILEPEKTSNGGHVSSVSVDDTVYPSYPDLGEVTIELETGVTYRLQLAVVGIGTGVGDNINTEAYMTDVSGDGSSVPEGGSKELVVEVRDEYDNPVSGVTVEAAVSTGSLASTSATTDDDGRASFTYEAPADIAEEQDVTIELSYAGDPGGGYSFDETNLEDVSMTVTILNSDDSKYKVVWQDPSGQTGVSCPNGVDGVCTIDASQTSLATLTVGTSPKAEFVQIDYGVNESAIGTFTRTTGETDLAGENSTDFEPVVDGVLEVYTVSGPSTDNLTLEVTNTPDRLEDNDDAVAADGPDSVAKDTTGGVNFSILNRYESSVEITKVELVSAPGNSKTLDDDGVTPNDEPAGAEIYVAGDVNDGWVDYNNGVNVQGGVVIDMDSDGADNNGNPEVSKGESFTIYLYEFEKNNGDDIDVSGESFDVTITYRVGGGAEQTVTFTIEVPS